MMPYKLKKRCVISASHYLELNYDSLCRNVHGHNWIITVTVSGKMLNFNGMLMDFKDIKDTINKLDHKHLNDVLQANPTAENIAIWVAEKIQEIIDDEWGGGHGSRPRVTEIEVQESEGNIICYTPILS
jgi:6-pyruvoyltetrahydropterin/6-carboxytetrahydropterin synthase